MLLLDQIERQVLADRQVVASLRAAGFDVELPNFHDERAQFDASLVAEPERAELVDGDQMELRRALGVA